MSLLSSLLVVVEAQSLHDRSNLVILASIDVLMVCVLLPLYLFYPALVNKPSRNGGPERTVKLLSKDQKRKEQQPLLSIVVPAYNEEDRLVDMLTSAYRYLSTPNCQAIHLLQSALRSKTSDRALIEWIVVSDGSTDQTLAVYRSFVRDQQPQKPPSRSLPEHVFIAVELHRNAGKGAAVQAGMAVSTGRFHLMVDADGATTFSNLELLAAALPEPTTYGTAPACAWGSRAHMQDAKPGGGNQRHLLRIFLMKAFHWFVRILCCGTSIRDTQCGFKLFTQAASQRLFQTLHLRRWAFDTELVVLAHYMSYAIVEVPVEWKEVDGSKLNTSPFNLALVSIGMLRDMICVRLCYLLGIWKVEEKGRRSKVD